jgi:hypothetical protein
MMCSRTTGLWVGALLCAGIALAQAQGIGNVKIGLGKQPNDVRVTLNPSPTGGITGQLENRLPKGRKGFVVEKGGNAIARTQVNEDGTFVLPAPPTPRQANFTLCLEVEGEAPICSAPGALAAFVNVRPAVGQLTAAPRGPVVGLQPSPAVLIAPADAAVLANVQINRTPTGSWRCTGKTGACSPTEVQVLARTVLNNSRSNIKNNIVVAPDGTITCKDSTNGSPCTAAEINDFASSLKTHHDTVKNSIGNVR